MWRPVGRRDGVEVYVPAVGCLHLVAVDDGHVLHAAPIRLTPTRRKTVDTVCGLEQSARPMLVVEDDDARALVPAWPPPKEILGHRRCGDCVAFTGEKRPHPMWLSLSIDQTEQLDDTAVSA